MTIWQIIIVVCLYFVIGGVINAVLAGDDDSAIIFVPFWPFFTVAILIVLILTLFGSIGQFIVKSVSGFIVAFKRLFNKKEEK